MQAEGHRFDPDRLHHNLPEGFEASGFEGLFVMTFIGLYDIVKRNADTQAFSRESV